MFTVGSHGYGDISSVDPAIFFPKEQGQSVSTYPRAGMSLGGGLG